MESIGSVMADVTRQPPEAPAPSAEPPIPPRPEGPPQKALRFPTAFTVLAAVLLLVWIAAFFVPAGVLFVLAVGAFITVTMKTEAIQTGIGRLATRFSHSGSVLVAMLMLVFALGGTTYGMWEETLGFFALLVPLALALGYDRMTGAAVIFLGAGTGVICSTVNPFATGVASDAAGISLGDGIGLRRGHVDGARRHGHRLRAALRAAGEQGARPLDRRHLGQGRRRGARPDRRRSRAHGPPEDHPRALRRVVPRDDL